MPALEGLARGDYDRLALFMPSRHAKSDIATKAFIPWFIARNPLKNVILLSHTQPLANTFGSAIRDLMARDTRHRQIFPEIQIDNSTHAKDFFRTHQGNNFWAFGINAGVPGRGGDLVVIDDPISSMQDALSSVVQDQLEETYKAVVKQRLQAQGKVLLIMTRWAPRDIAARILEAEGTRWKVLAIPAQPPDPKCAECGDGLTHDCQGPFLWEEHRGREYYIEAKKDVFIWNAMYQQAPSPKLMQGFKENWLRFYVNKFDAQGRERQAEFREDGSVLSQPADFDLIRKFNTYVFVDPALGKEAAHDRTCILVFAAGPERRLFLVDAVLDRLDPGERIKHLIRLARNWKPLQILYEEYALQADTYFLREALEAEGIHDLAVTSVGRKGVAGLNGGRLKKGERIMQLAQDFEASRIWLPKRMVRRCADGSEIDIINYFITKEYLPWAGEDSVAHEDMLDCMSRLRDPDFMPMFVTRDNSDEEFDYGPSQGGLSWEARY